VKYNYYNDYTGSFIVSELGKDDTLEVVGDEDGNFFAKIHTPAKPIHHIREGNKMPLPDFNVKLETRGF